MHTIKRMPEFDEWLASLRDGMTRIRLTRRLEKVQRGLLGDVAPVGEGVSEMREFFGSGWRMYFVERDGMLIVMLGGGDKSTQSDDIARAIALSRTLTEYLSMTRKIKVADLPDFDMAEYLKTDEDVANYLTLVLEENDPAELTHALGTIARARGMTEVARASGLTREALYKALRPTSHPRFDTIARVCTALGVKLVAQPMQT